MPESISSNIVDLIMEFLSEKKKEHNVDELFETQLLQDEVLSLLEQHSTVIYFPIKGEENYGFHTVRVIGGREKEFVYINTAHSIVHQIFAAAHELGHIWRLETYLSDRGIDISCMSERAMDRFAAELLAPRASFINTSRKLIAEAAETAENAEDRAAYGISERDLVKVVIRLMSKYMIPYKAVVCRFCELGILNEDSGERMLSFARDAFFVDIIKEESLAKLETPTNRKGIHDFSEILKDAEKQHALSPSIVSYIRDEFEYPVPSEKENSVQQITIHQERGLSDV